MRHPDAEVLKDYFDPREDLTSQQDTLIARLEKEIALHLNNSGLQAREKMWANNLKVFVQENA
ncbi:MAG TPA: hypothetical protein VK145_03225, partial [Candidatus Nanoarchaeia archaeon]|nr:hypothetical protein [Candidatus Nanoarchaeia archaeon]